jgi:hypothetical protein
MEPLQRALEENDPIISRFEKEEEEEKRKKRAFLTNIIFQGSISLHLFGSRSYSSV